MRIIKILLQSLLLTLTNLFSILIGFTVFHFSTGINQSLIQIPVAVILSVIIFIAWIFLLKKRSSGIIPESKIDYLLIFIVSLIWVPIIFYPLHYFTQHYISSFRNIYWVWFFQMPVNTLILFLSYLLLKKIKSK